MLKIIPRDENNNRKPAGSDGDDSCPVSGDYAPLVPEGDYRVQVTGWRTRLMHGRQPKVCLNCTVLDSGSYLGAVIPRWFNVEALIGPPRSRGRFKVGIHSKLFREYCRLSGRKDRPDRISIGALVNVTLIARVRTVKEEADGTAIPEAAQYSVIDRFLELEAGSL